MSRMRNSGSPSTDCLPKDQTSNNTQQSSLSANQLNQHIEQIKQVQQEKTNVNQSIEESRNENQQLVEKNEKFKKEAQVMHQTNEQLRESNVSLLLQIQRKQEILADAAKQEEQEGKSWRRKT